MIRFNICAAIVSALTVCNIVMVALGERVTRPIAIIWLAILLFWVGIAAVYRNLWGRR